MKRNQDWVTWAVFLFTISIVLIQSDHGIRIVDEDKSDNEDLFIKMGNFRAYRFPDQPGENISDQFNNVNSFRIIFNTYFNGDYELLENKVIIKNNEIKNWDQIKDNVLKNYN